MTNVRNLGSVLAIAAMAVGLLVILPGLQRATTLPHPAPPPDSIEWSDHARESHPVAAQAIAAALAAATCKPDFRVCRDGRVYLVCWGLGGIDSHGLVPLVPGMDGKWIAKSAFWTTQSYIKKIFEESGCEIGGVVEIIPPIEWEEDR